MTSSSVSLKWKNPIYDGGANLIGFTVEYAEFELTDEIDEEQSELNWIVAYDHTKLRTPTCIVTNLQSDKLYKFRVYAHNSVGQSVPSESTNSVKPEDSFEPPVIKCAESAMKNLSLQAGTTLHLSYEFHGRPSPNVTWVVPEVVQSDRYIIETLENSTSFLLKDITRNDGGDYVLTVENTTGSSSLVTNVKVMDIPSAPIDFKICNVSKDSVSVSWDDPLNDGGTPVKNYVLEKREATRKSWITVESCCRLKSFKFINLNQGFSYFFR